MLSKEEIEKNFQSIVDMTYTDHGCDVSVLVVHMRDQAIFAIELQAKLDAIEKLCLDEMVVRGDMSDRNFAHGYNSALARVMQILRGDE